MNKFHDDRDKTPKSLIPIKIPTAAQKTGTISQSLTRPRHELATNAWTAFTPKATGQACGQTAASAGFISQVIDFKCATANCPKKGQPRNANAAGCGPRHKAGSVARHQGHRPDPAYSRCPYAPGPLEMQSGMRSVNKGAGKALAALESDCSYQ